MTDYVWSEPAVFFPGQQTREEWLETRRRGIGASEIADIVGVGFHSAADLMRRKLTGEDNYTPSERMRLGTVLQPHALERFRNETGWGAEEWDSLMMAGFDSRFMATPDALVSESPDLLPFGAPADAKCVFGAPNDDWGLCGSDTIPDNYRCQLTQQMAIAGADHGYLAVLFVGYGFRWYRIPFDPELWQVLYSAGRDWLEAYDAVRDSDPAEVPDHWEAPSVRAARERLARYQPGTVVEIDDAFGSASGYAAMWREATRQAKAAQQMADACKGKLLEALGPHEKGRFASGSITQKKVSRGEYTVKASEYLAVRISFNKKDGSDE